MAENNAFEIVKFSGDLYGENTYLCINQQTNEALLIDPGTKAVKDYLDKNSNIKLVAVLLTHGHSDHILHTDFYIETYEVPLYIHQKEAHKLVDIELNLSNFGESFSVYSKPTTFDGCSGSLSIGSFELTFFLAPGHTEGLVIYHLVDTNIYFVGDTVFEDSIGRYDLPGADIKAHYETLNKINTLPDDSKFYAGHGKVFKKASLVSNAVFQMFINSGV